MTEFSGIPPLETGADIDAQPSVLNSIHRKIPVEMALGFMGGLILLMLGMTVIFVASVLDGWQLANRPWNSAILIYDMQPGLSPGDAYPIRTRLVQRPTPLEEDLTLQLLGQLVSWERFEHTVRLSDPEYVIAVDLPIEELTPLLASGRLPEAGAPEVLAGPLARDDSFYLDGERFTVVGRLSNTVSGFIFSYLLPHASSFEYLFAPSPKTVSGLLVVSGEALIKSGVLPDRPLLLSRKSVSPPASEDSEIELEGEQETTDEAAQTPVLPAYTGGILLTSARVVYATVAGLMLAALGGALAHYFLFRILHVRRYRPLYPILDMMQARPRLYWGMHGFLYGIFFLAMLSALSSPLLTYRISQYIEAVFSHGGLGYIGEAYARKDVQLAAWATFYNNFIEQTLGLTFFVSLIPIPLGLIKTVLSFMLVGGAMAPMWVGSAAAYVLHSITMVLELQGYIIACFAITAWPLTLLQGIWAGTPWSSLKTGLRMFFSAILLTAAMLGIAALYEAYTLIRLL